MDNRREIFARKLLGTKLNPHFRVKVPEQKNRQEGLTMPQQPPAVTDKIPKYRAHKDVEVIHSACFSCNTTCEVLIFKDKRSGKVLKVEGDPDSPVTKGVLCAKGLAAKDLLYNPNRLKYPMKRVGRRGEGKWEKISWDEALTITAETLKDFKNRYGPQGIAFLEGTRRGWSRVFSRLANAFGAVNHGAAGWAQCLWPRLVDSNFTFGAPYMETADYENTNLILVWGANPPNTWPVIAANIMDARQRGAKLMVVDPYLSETAAKADLWLQLRPGTDTALALSMLHVILESNLYDSDFVNNWTAGFEELKMHVKSYTPEWGERITRVPAELIIKAARLYAAVKPACIFRCVALDQLHDSVQACRAVSLLAAVTGNIGIPGGNVLPSNRGEISQNTHDFILHDLIDPEKIVMRSGYDKYPLLCGKPSPVPSAHMPTLWDTMATGQPYPIKAALIFGSNAVVSYSNSNRVIEALNNLDFLVVADLFMTPTAELADIVLPASSWLERDNVISSFQTSPTYTVVQQKAAEVPEARSDVDIICALAEKLGLQQYFWKNAEDMYDYLLKPTGLTLRELKQKVRIYAPLSYREYLKKGFRTPSGKVELYSSQLEKYNCAPLPVYEEPFESPVSNPQLARKYPYILTTGGRFSVFRHTENRQNPILREICPRPRIFIHPETANANGIQNDDYIIVETKTGFAGGYAFLTEGLHPDVIQVPPGWPGRENINRVISWDKCAEGIGTVPMRGLLCRIRKAEESEKMSANEGKE